MPTFQAHCDGSDILIELSFHDLEMAAQEACQWAVENGSSLTHLVNLTSGEACHLRCDRPGSPLLNQATHKP